MSKTNKLKALSNEIADLIEKTAPYIVQILGRRRLGATGVSLGDGLIATANHVVRKDSDIKIGLHDGTTATAELVGRDPTTDLALLKTNSEIPAFPLAKEIGKVGHIILALGKPNNATQATLGVISALGDAWQTSAGGHIDTYLQTDIVMYPGFSGGPLINADGEMVGLNTSGLSRDISLTIPAATVARVANTLSKHGHIKRAYLGVSMQRAKLPETVQDSLGQRTGLLIVNVESGSPADQSGLVMGDTIVAIANIPVKRHDDLMTQLTPDRIGAETAVSIIRSGQLQSQTIILGERQ